MRRQPCYRQRNQRSSQNRLLRNSLQHSLYDAPGTPAQPLTPLVAEAQSKAEVISTPSPVTAAASPLITPHQTQPLPTVAAPVLSAPLGSHEWQQSLSQHISLFTRQGQQSAELRLHPQDLGEVQISLKVDDNQAQIQMVSPHQHVRAALEAALPVPRIAAGRKWHSVRAKQHQWRKL